MNMSNRSELEEPEADRSRVFVRQARHRLRHIGALIASVAAVGAVASGLLGYWSVWKTVKTELFSGRTNPTASGPTLSRLSLVVIPFSFTGPSEEQYLSDAITGDLIAELSRISGSFILAQSTSQSLKGKQVDIRRLPIDLGVRYALEGSIQKLDKRVRVAAALVDAEQGRTVWSDKFDGERADLFAIQSDIVTRLARALNIELIQADAERIARQKNTKPEALELTTLGWSFYLRPRSRENLEIAREHFQKAVDKDENAADAVAGLAMATAVIVTLHWSSDPASDSAKSEKLARTALEADPRNAAAFFALGWLNKTKKPAEAVLAFQAALNLNPNFPDATRQLAESYLWAARPQEAIDATERFLKLSPRDANLGTAYWTQAYAFLLLGKTNEAIPLLVKGRALNPKFSGMHSLLASAYGLQGDIEEAKKSLLDAQRLRPALTSVRYYDDGRIPEFRELAKQTIDVGLIAAGLPAN